MEEQEIVEGTGLAVQQWNGGRGWARTSNPQLRRLMLYPIELRARADIIAHPR
jgi:hypothetical protein